MGAGASMRDTAVCRARTRCRRGGSQGVVAVAGRDRPEPPPRSFEWARAGAGNAARRNRSAATDGLAASQPNSTSAAPLNWITRRLASMHMIGAGAPSSVAASRASTPATGFQCRAGPCRRPRSRGPALQLEDRLVAPARAPRRADRTSGRSDGGGDVRDATGHDDRQPERQHEECGPAPTHPVAGDSACRRGRRERAQRKGGGDRNQQVPAQGNRGGRWPSSWGGQSKICTNPPVSPKCCGVGRKPRAGVIA